MNISSRFKNELQWMDEPLVASLELYLKAFLDTSPKRRSSGGKDNKDPRSGVRE